MKHTRINTVWSSIPILLFFALSSWAQDINDERINEVIASALEQTTQMDAWFQKAVGSHGKDYLDAEYHLRKGGAAALDTLQQNRDHPDPVARLMVECLLAWMQGTAREYQKALDYLDRLPQELAGTCAPFPSADGVAGSLSEWFGSRVADFLALRLAKEIDWPRWRVVGILLYLEEQKLPSTTSAVIRFASETHSNEGRECAIDILRAIADPELKQKLAIERKRLDDLDKKLPKDLANMLSDS
jgi:hypothetical protein